MTKENMSSTNSQDCGDGKSRRLSKPTTDLTEQSSTSKSLSRLLYDQLVLRDDIQEAEGEITEEQDLIWRNQEIEIKDKVDAYGEVLSTLEADIEKLKYIKREAGTRVSKALSRTEKTYARLKERLNFLSAGSPLRGYTYSFHPYQSEKREVWDISAVSSEHIYLNIEIKESLWKELLEVMPHPMGYSIKKKFAKVSELPNDHPAVVVTRKPSVRIT